MVYEVPKNKVHRVLALSYQQKYQQLFTWRAFTALRSLPNRWCGQIGRSRNERLWNGRKASRMAHCRSAHFDGWDYRGQCPTALRPKRSLTPWAIKKKMAGFKWTATALARNIFAGKSYFIRRR